jgi:hypothetical protein
MRKHVSHLRPQGSLVTWSRKLFASTTVRLKIPPLRLSVHVESIDGALRIQLGYNTQSVPGLYRVLFSLSCLSQRLGSVLRRLNWAQPRATLLLRLFGWLVRGRPAA